MQEMIAARRSAEVKEERHDLFSNLLDANDGLAETGEKLSDDGLFGNVFMFMVAGTRISFHCMCGEEAPTEHESGRLRGKS